jgi:hypothetical protein
MAVDKLVDSTQLDADLTSVANAIRTKGGTSAQLAFPAGFVSAVEAIPTGGGGSGNYETGTLTLASDFALSTSPKPIPGLQLGFVPDYFLMMQTRESFEARTEGLGGGLWGLEVYNRSWSAPFAQNASTTPETVSSDYTFFVVTSLSANSNLVNGYGYSGFSLLGTAYYPRYSVNADGTISVGRYSSATTVMKSGTYRYFAMKI